MSKIIDACNAIVTAIDFAGVLPHGSATPRRSWNPEYSLEELKLQLRLDVLPVDRTRTQLDRSTDTIAPQVVICLQKYVGKVGNDAACLALCDLIEVIDDLLNRQEIGEFTYDDSQIKPIYDPDALREHGVFKTFLRVNLSTDHQPHPV